jgi:hypothetical protein
MNGRLVCDPQRYPVATLGVYHIAVCRNCKMHVFRYDRRTAEVPILDYRHAAE